MDITIQAYNSKCRVAQNGNIGVRFSEVGTKNAINIHISRPTAEALVRALTATLAEEEKGKES